MANTDVSDIPKEITVSGTSEHTITFTSDQLKRLPFFEVQVRVTSGTVNFNSLGSTAASGYALSDTDNDLIITVWNNVLRYKGSSGSETFVVSV